MTRDYWIALLGVVVILALVGLIVLIPSERPVEQIGYISLKGEWQIKGLESEILANQTVWDDGRGLMLQFWDGRTLCLHSGTDRPLQVFIHHATEKADNSPSGGN